MTDDQRPETPRTDDPHDGDAPRPDAPDEELLTEGTDAPDAADIEDPASQP